MALLQKGRAIALSILISPWPVEQLTGSHVYSCNFRAALKHWLQHGRDVKICNAISPSGALSSSQEHVSIQPRICRTEALLLEKFLALLCSEKGSRETEGESRYGGIGND